jgi:hypothetical protein
MTAAALGMRVQIEKWFARQGLPLFIQDYRARRSIQPAMVILGTLWIIEVLVLPLNRRYSLAFNLVAVVAGLAIVLGAVTVVGNFTRRLGPLPELVCTATTLVLLPALLPLIFGRQVRDAVLTVAINTGLLALLWLLTGGIVPVAVWSFKEARRQVFQLLGVLARALPVLFVGVTLLFLTAEIWQIAAQLDLVFLLVVCGLFIAIGTLCLVTQLVREVSGCCDHAEKLEWPSLVERVRGIKSKRAQCFEELAELHVQRQPPKRTSPTELQRVNIGVVLLFAETIQILVVSAVLAGFFLVFGLLAVSSPTAKGYLGNVSPNPMPGLPHLMLWGRPIVLMQELVKVTVIIGLFSYLIFVFYAVTEKEYIKTFLRHVDERIRDVLAVYAIYSSTLWAPRREPMNRGRDYRLTFEVPATFEARKAMLMVSQDGASATPYELYRQGDGRFVRSIELSARTEFRYHYVIDDQPCKDHGADRYVLGSDGVEQSVLTLPGRAPGAQRIASIPKEALRSATPGNY